MFLQVDSGDVCTTMYMYLMPLICTLKMVKNVKFYVTFLLPQLKKNLLSKPNDKSDQPEENGNGWLPGGAESSGKSWPQREDLGVLVKGSQSTLHPLCVDSTGRFCLAREAGVGALGEWSWVNMGRWCTVCRRRTGWWGWDRAQTGRWEGLGAGRRTSATVLSEQSGRETAREEGWGNS